MERFEDYYTQDTNGNYLFVGDYIKSIEYPDGNNIKFTYVLGGQYYRTKDGNFVRGVENTGIEYTETYPITTKTLKTKIDGVEVELYYKDIDYKSNEIEIENSDFNLTRKAIASTITKMNLGDTWNDAEAIESHVFKNDILMGISDKPRHKVDIEIDRGGVSVKEKHFKLGECNTFEDLENYGNNYFGLNN